MLYSYTHVNVYNIYMAVDLNYFIQKRRFFANYNSTLAKLWQTPRAAFDSHAVTLPNKDKHGRIKRGMHLMKTHLTWLVRLYKSTYLKKG